MSSVSNEIQNVTNNVLVKVSKTKTKMKMKITEKETKQYSIILLTFLVVTSLIMLISYAMTSHIKRINVDREQRDNILKNYQSDEIYDTSNIIRINYLQSQEKWKNILVGVVVFVGLVFTILLFVIVINRIFNE